MIKKNDGTIKQFLASVQEEVDLLYSKIDVLKEENDLLYSKIDVLNEEKENLTQKLIDYQQDDTAQLLQDKLNHIHQLSKM